jgi:hypothetical protein
MPRHERSSLISLIPQKGEATRPEPVAEHAAERAIEQPREPAIVQATAHESSPAIMQESEQESIQANERASNQESSHASTPSDAPVFPSGRLRTPLQTDLDSPAAYQDGPRTSVSFRMTDRLRARLRLYAFDADQKKQDIIDQAVHEFLRRKGY